LGFDKVRQGYGRSLSFLVRIRVIIAVFVALLVLTGWHRRTYRISPNEDQGYFISIQAPEGLR